MTRRLFPTQASLIATLLLLATASAQSPPSVQAESLQPNGFGWAKISYIRQLGYVEGFKEGRSIFPFAEGSKDKFLSSCDQYMLDANASPLRKDCILHRFWGKTFVDMDTSSVLEAMNKFYAQVENLPIRWGSAVIISGAMVSGVPVDEKELQIVRQEDAKTTATLSKH